MGDRLRTSQPPRYVTSHPGQLSLLPSAGWEMSTSQSAEMLCFWSMQAHSVFGCMCGWHVKLCDPSLTRALLAFAVLHLLQGYKCDFSYSCASWYLNWQRASRGPSATTGARFNVRMIDNGHNLSRFSHHLTLFSVIHYNTPCLKKRPTFDLLY